MKLFSAIITLCLIAGLTHECLLDEDTNGSWKFLQGQSWIEKVFNIMVISNDANISIFKGPSNTYKKQISSEILHWIALDLEEPK